MGYAADSRSSGGSTFFPTEFRKTPWAGLPLLFLPKGGVENFRGKSAARTQSWRPKSKSLSLVGATELPKAAFDWAFRPPELNSLSRLGSGLRERFSSGAKAPSSFRDEFSDAEAVPFQSLIYATISSINVPTAS